MTRKFLKDSLLWGFILWLIGYILGFVFFALVPKDLIGWYLMPLGIIFTLAIAFRFIRGDLKYFVKIALIWTAIAVVFDYLFIVWLLNSGFSYYKLDVYLYYGLTLALPIIVGWLKNRK